MNPFWYLLRTNVLCDIILDKSAFQQNRSKVKITVSIFTTLKLKFIQDIIVTLNIFMKLYKNQINKWSL